MVSDPDDEPTLFDLAKFFADRVSLNRPPAEPDAWDPDRLPYGVLPGGNKYGLTTCPFCSKPGTVTPRNDLPRAFLFRDELSAREYRISWLCQNCQDATFREPMEESDP
jgi:hypothetical protein